MNKERIEKIIKLTNGVCPEITYSNPLLDRNVTKAVSKSIVGTLYKSEQIGRKPKVRSCMLREIRNMCRSSPEGHVEIDDDLTEILISFYKQELLKSTASKSAEKQLNAFLVRKSKKVNLNSSFESKMNPEVLQAMLNLNESVVFSKNITDDIIHWNRDDPKSSIVLENMWNEKVNETSFTDNVSIKMKHKIENVLLNISLRLLEGRVLDSELLLIEPEVISLVKACSSSAECFQICTRILNSLFIDTKFNNHIENFISKFVENCKLNDKITISILYPSNLCNLVTILDLNLDELPASLKDSYVNKGQSYLKCLHENSENDLIMLLSHFPTWFNIYFNE